MAYITSTKSDTILANEKDWIELSLERKRQYLGRSSRRIDAIPFVGDTLETSIPRWNSADGDAPDLIALACASLAYFYRFEKEPEPFNLEAGIGPITQKLDHSIAIADREVEDKARAVLHEIEDLPLIVQNCLWNFIDPKLKPVKERPSFSAKPIKYIDGDED